MKKFMFPLLNLFFPIQCSVCNKSLIEGEECICLECLNKIPYTDHLNLDYNNDTIKIFEGKFTFINAASLCIFTKGGIMQNVIHEIKYNNNKELAIYIGYIAGLKIKKSNQFSDIDYIIPIPLHKKRLKERGYNQAELIAKGIEKATGIPILHNGLERIINNKTQTKNSKEGRWTNVKDIFNISNTTLINNKKIMLIDDVITTGSTIESCALKITEKTNALINIFSIAIAI